MATADRIDAPGLGALRALAESPPGEQFWVGTFGYDDGRPAYSNFYLCVRAGYEPTPSQCAFAAATLTAIAERIRDARQLLAQRLGEDPGFFGVDEAEAARTLQKGDALLPFGLPEPTFYEPEEWQIRFAESGLPACDPYGVVVAFVGAQAAHVEALSGAEELV